MIYLAVPGDFNNKSDVINIQGILENAGINLDDVQIKNTCLELFCDEEAGFRLGNYEENNEFKVEDDEVRNSIIASISIDFFDKEIFDYDYMDDIVDEVVKSELEEI